MDFEDNYEINFHISHWKKYIVWALLEPSRWEGSNGRSQHTVFTEKYLILNYPCYTSLSIAKEMSLITHGNICYCPHQNHLTEVNLMRDHNIWCWRFYEIYQKITESHPLLELYNQQTNYMFMYLQSQINVFWFIYPFKYVWQFLADILLPILSVS